MYKICDTCETAIHCAKYGCIPERIGKPAQPQQQPVAWTVAGQVRDWSKDFSAYQTKHYVRPVYTSPPAQTDWEAVAADQAMTIALLKADQPAQQEQGDSICQGNDGCPTEKAVLQRFWRGQSIPDEHYPAWFKPAQEFVCSTGLCHYRKPLTDELENAFKDGWNAAKAAHGIKENT